MDTPIVKVIDIEGSAQVTEKLQQGDFKFCLLQGKPVQLRAVIKDFTYYEFTTGYSGDYFRLHSACLILCGRKHHVGS